MALVDNEQRLHLKVVEPIFGDEDFYYLAGGLEEGDEIIVSAMGVPIEGMRVSPDNGNGMADAPRDVEGAFSDTEKAFSDTVKASGDIKGSVSDEK